MNLTDFTAFLRENGFQIETSQYLEANKLLILLAERGVLISNAHSRFGIDPLQCRHYLAPIFCRSKADFDRFELLLTSGLSNWQASFAPSIDTVGGGSGDVINQGPWDVMIGRFAPVITVVLIILITLIPAAIMDRLYPTTVHLRILKEIGDARSRRIVAAPEAEVSAGNNRLVLDNFGRADVVLLRLDPILEVVATLQGYSGARVALHAFDLVSTDVPVKLSAPLLPETGVSKALAPTKETSLFGPVSPTKRIVASVDKIKVLTIGAVIAGIALLLFGWRTGRVRRLVLERAEVAGPMRLTDVLDATADVPNFSKLKDRHICGHLSNPVSGPVLELDVFQSVLQTANSAGFFSPSYIARKVVPQFIALVQRNHVDDHFWRVISDWLETLYESDVRVQVFSFRDDPRVCFSSHDPMTPIDLMNRYQGESDKALLIFAETSTFLDNSGTSPASWMSQLSTWEHIAAFVPEALYRWSAAELVIARSGFLLYPASEQGLRLFSQERDRWRLETLFPAPFSRPYPLSLLNRAVDFVFAGPIGDGASLRLVEELQTYLGANGFAWLCLCAIYPEISFALTLRLGSLLETGGRPGSDPTGDALLPLIRLPWLRQCYMPTWMRRLLIARLEDDPALADIAQRGRSHIKTLLLALNTSVRTEITRNHRSRLATLALPTSIPEFIAAVADSSPLKEAIFLRFVFGRKHDVTAFEVDAKLLDGYRLGKLEERKRATAIPGDRSGQVVRGVLSWIEFVRATHPTHFAVAVSLGVTCGLISSLLAGGVAIRVESEMLTIPRVVALSTADGGRELLASYEGGTIGVWSAADNSAPRILVRGVVEAIVKAQLSPASSLIGILGNREDLKVIKLDGGTPRGNREILSIEKVSDFIWLSENLVLSVLTSGELRISDVATGAVQHDIQLKTSASRVVMAPNRPGVAATFGRGPNLVVVSTNDLTRVATTKLEDRQSVEDLSWNADGTQIAAVAGGVAYVWNLRAGVTMALPGQTGKMGISMLRFGASDNELIGSLLDGRLVRWTKVGLEWSLVEGFLFNYGSPIRTLETNAGGRFVGLGGVGKAPLVIASDSGTVVLGTNSEVAPMVTYVGFSDTQAILASGDLAISFVRLPLPGP